MSFDPNQKYGIVRGATSGIRFEQDGKLYNARHEEVDIEGNPVKPKPGPKPKAATKQDKPEGVKTMAEQAEEEKAEQ